MSWIKIIFISVLAALHFSAYAINLPKEERVPGGVALIELPKQFSHADKPVVTFKQNQVAVVRKPQKNQPGTWVAILGIPLDSKLGEEYILVKSQNSQVRVPFTIAGKKYLEEKLTFKNKNHSDPDEKTLERIKSEAIHLGGVFGKWTQVNHFDPALHKPLEGRMSSAFGKKRIINNKLRSQHKGIDIAAPLGTPVLAAQSGRVIDVGDYFYTGNTVIIDHGQGMQTIYCHLNDISVKANQQVSVKQKIGTVGKTGRATGPHLHFGVNLNNQRVAPNLFFVN